MTHFRSIRFAVACAILPAAPLWADTIQTDEGVPSASAIETINTADGTGGRMTVPVMVNGQGPFHFIIDTGADRTVISRELAARLNLPEGRKSRLVSIGGAHDVRTVRIDRLQMARKETRQITAPALPARYLGADGILGIDSLKNQRVVFDFVTQTMTVEPADTKEIRSEKDPVGTITVTAKSKLGRLVLVDADAQGQDIRVIVDTGGQNSVGNSALRRMMAHRGSGVTFKPVELISVVGERLPADFAVVGQMRIGGIRIGNAAIAFADAHPFAKFGLTKRPAMLLGMESLRAFRRVSIDFANRRVKFLMPQGAPIG